MRSQGIRIAAAVVLAVLGTVVLVRYVETARAEAVAAEELVDVLVVEAPIVKGTAAADLEGSVRVVQVPARTRAAGAVSDIEDLGDLHASVDLVPGEQVVKARFAAAGAAARGEAPEELLQVTVSLETDRALGGNVRPGDTVGVVLSFRDADAGDGTSLGSTTHLALHKVLVSDVGVQAKDNPAAEGDGERDGVSAARIGTYLVTLAADAPAVEQIVFAAENGSIWLTAEAGAAPEDGTRVVTSGNVFAGAQP
jgi:pilus assembly protein CpaB